MDISSEHEQDEEAAGAAAAAAAQAAGEPVEEVAEDDVRPELPEGLTPEQAAFETESITRFKAAEAKLGELSRRLPPDKEFTIPTTIQTDATINLMLQLMIERGIVSHDEFLLRKHRGVAELVEQVAEHAQAMLDSQSDLVGPDGEPIQKMPPVPPALARRRGR